MTIDQKIREEITALRQEFNGLERRRDAIYDPLASALRILRRWKKDSATTYQLKRRAERLFGLPRQRYAVDTVLKLVLPNASKRRHKYKQALLHARRRRVKAKDLKRYFTDRGGLAFATQPPTNRRRRKKRSR